MIYLRASTIPLRISLFYLKSHMCNARAQGLCVLRASPSKGCRQVPPAQLVGDCQVSKASMCAKRRIAPPPHSSLEACSADAAQLPQFLWLAVPGWQRAWSLRRPRKLRTGHLLPLHPAEGRRLVFLKHLLHAGYVDFL